MGALSDKIAADTPLEPAVVEETTPEVVEAPVEVAADEPLVSRDERHDSIDPATGALTEEAVALRRAMAAGDA